MPAYAELAVTSNFSFLRGASDPEELVAQARQLGLAGLGIADRNSVAGVVRAHTAVRELGAGDHGPFKLAVGARLVFADGTPDILAYPRDRAAWGRLTRLLSLGKRRAKKGCCILGLPDLLDFIEGLNLIVMPSARLHAGRLGGRFVVVAMDSATTFPPPLRGRDREGGGGKHRVRDYLPPQPSPTRGEGAHRICRDDSASLDLASLLAQLKEAAPRRVWLAASMLYRGDDARRLAKLAAIAGAAHVPLIAVNDALYHAASRRALADVVTCIREHEIGRAHV